MKKISIILFILFLNCSQKFSPIPYYDVVNDKSIADGKYPAQLIFLDEELKELKSLESYSYCWVIIKNGKVDGLDTGEWTIPGTSTTYPLGIKQLEELPLIYYYKIKNVPNFKATKFEKE